MPARGQQNCPAAANRTAGVEVRSCRVHPCGVLLLLEWPVARPVTIEQEEQVKSREEILEILEAFDLTGSFRDAGELAGCSHHTVAGYVAKRDAGELPDDGPAEGFLDPVSDPLRHSIAAVSGGAPIDRGSSVLVVLCDARREPAARTSATNWRVS